MGQKINTYKDLLVWRKSVNMVSEVYKLTSKFPTAEVYGLTSQIRRSAISIPSNIAEGWARGNPKYFINFLKIFRGSLAELETQLIISQNLNYIMNDEFSEINHQLTEISKMLSGLIKSSGKKLDPTIY